MTISPELLSEWERCIKDRDIVTAPEILALIAEIRSLRLENAELRAQREKQASMIRYPLPRWLIEVT